MKYTVSSLSFTCLTGSQMASLPEHFGIEIFLWLGIGTILDRAAETLLSEGTEIIQHSFAV